MAKIVRCDGINMVGAGKKRGYWDNWTFEINETLSWIRNELGRSDNGLRIAAGGLKFDGIVGG